MPNESVRDVEPLRPHECELLQAALDSGEADPSVVHERLVAAIQGGRQWRSPEWVAMRAARIGTICEQCGSADAPFTLQHFWHPVQVPHMLRALREEHREAAFADFAKAHADAPAFRDRIRSEGDLREGCPRCGGWNLRQRSGTGRSEGKSQFVCATQRNGRVCNNEFNKPVMVQPLQVQSGLSIMRRAFSASYEPTYQDTAKSLYRRAVQIAVGEFARYMAGEGTATFCKRCAYNWDKLGVRLCVECRAAWHPLHEAVCKACQTGGAWVLCSRCGKARHLDRYDACYACIHRDFDDPDEI